MSERPNRDYIIWIFGGAYLLYLAIKMGWSLLQGSIELRECFFPVLFAVAGAFFLVKGVKRLKQERETSQTLEEDDNADVEKDDNEDAEKDDHADKEQEDDY